MARSCGCDLMESLSCHEGLLLSFPSASLPASSCSSWNLGVGSCFCALLLPKPLESSRRRMTRKASCLLVRPRRQESIQTFAFFRWVGGRRARAACFSCRLPLVPMLVWSGVVRSDARRFSRYSVGVEIGYPWGSPGWGFCFVDGRSGR